MTRHRFPLQPLSLAEVEHRKRGVMRGAQTVAARSGRARAVVCPVTTSPVLRQAPLARPRHRLTFDRRIVIGPDRPVPWPYCNGWLPLFRDDLAAIADHGSPLQVGRG